ncbi:hypothetical protein G5C60_03390 [Streptomyces sp. HC44]|uniref:Uncharacterized protein n=1 Tax=Streptomyces scabichelini TaxID=2711217 RepID=A0A6G4UY79_9ACTN|nr:hypothetical protein [Streptomyces scabichelini]NGO06732.1 hypothetical protein [Streptomyces scabichelini]
MDYCSSCHRHLNGALVCPGCGAYAPDIAPPAAEGRTVPTTTDTAVTGTTGTAEWEFTASGTWHGGDLRDEAAVGAGTDEVPHPGPSGIPEGSLSAPQGRAARRRQLARWKKNKRRAVVATAVAIVGGGLTVASLDRHSADGTQAQATRVPDNPNRDAAEVPEAQHTRPASTQPDTHRSSPTTPPAQSPATNLPRQQSATPAHRATPPVARPDAAAAARPTATSAPQPRTSSPTSSGANPDGTGRTAEQPSSPSPTPTAADSTDPGRSQAGPSPAATSPSEICLLVVCLG